MVRFWRRNENLHTIPSREFKRKSLSILSLGQPVHTLGLYHIAQQLADSLIAGWSLMCDPVDRASLTRAYIMVYLTLRGMNAPFNLARED